MNFEEKPSGVVGEEVDYSYDVSPVFKDKFTVVYIKHSKDIKERDRCEGDGSADH